MNAHSLIFAAKDIIPLVGLYPIAFTNSFVVRCGRKKKCGSLSRGYILRCRSRKGAASFFERAELYSIFWIDNQEKLGYNRKCQIIIKSCLLKHSMGIVFLW